MKALTPRRARELLAELDVLAQAVTAATRHDLLTAEGRRDCGVALNAIDHQVGYLTYLLGEGPDAP